MKTLIRNSPLALNIIIIVKKSFKAEEFKQK